jgi:hypothetical protein
MAAQRERERESKRIAILFFNLLLDGVNGQRHPFVALPPGQRAGTHFKGGWVGESCVRTA